MLCAASALDADVEAQLAASVLRMLRKPGLGGPAQPALFLRPDHLQRIAPALAALRLHFAEHDCPAAAQDEVELVTAGPGVRGEDPVAAEPVAPTHPALGRCASCPSVPPVGGGLAPLGRRWQR